MTFLVSAADRASLRLRSGESLFVLVASDHELKSAGLKAGLTVIDPQDEEAKASAGG